MRHHNQYTKARRRHVNTVGYTLLAALSIGSLSISIAKELTDRELARLTSPAYAAMPRTTATPTGNPTVQEQIYTIGQTRGLTLRETLQMLDLANCESHFNPNAQNYNASSKSFDSGLFQFNNKYQPQVTLECAGNIACSTNAAIDIYQKQGNWKAWTCGK